MNDSAVKSLADDLCFVVTASLSEPTPPNLNELADAVERATAVWVAEPGDTINSIAMIEAMQALKEAHARSGPVSKAQRKTNTSP